MEMVTLGDGEELLYIYIYIQAVLKLQGKKKKYQRIVIVSCCELWLSQRRWRQSPTEPVVIPIAILLVNPVLSTHFPE